MQSGPATLIALAEAVADGANVDWDHAESSANDGDERRIISQLRSLAVVAGAARAQMITWGPLEIRQEVGKGSFGTVYRAWDTHLEREVALKLLRGPDPGRGLGSSAIREGRLLAQIRHPNVVTVHGADIFDTSVGIWMEFVSGRTLKDILQERGPFGAHEAAVVGRDLCRALAAVHKQGFVHRDVKAQNVMREAGGRIVLMDFGASDDMVTGSPGGALAGTPVYLAPEVLRGDSPSVKSDLYSLGILLYHLVSGEFPVIGRSLDDFRDRHANRQSTLLRDARPDLPPDFLKAVDCATAADPKDRPESAGAMELLLERALGVGTGPIGSGESTAVRPSYLRRAVTGWPGLVVATALVLLALVTFSGMRLPWSTAPVVRRNSVAILPFTNLGETSDGDYLSMGITQDVVAHLATLRDLRIIAGASTVRYKGQATSPVDVGRTLGVATVLDGSVQRSGNRLHIVSRLVDATTGEQIWSDVFERNVEEVFAMQSEISRKIALALRGELSQTDTDRLKPAAGNFEAFNLYLKGRYYWALRTEDGVNRSIQYFQESLARDPGYAPAYVGLADSYTSLGTYGLLPRSEAYARAADAAEKAVSLDDGLAEAHASLAYARKNRFEWAAAESSFKRAIELQPGYSAAHHWYSIFLTQRGRFPEAITEIKAAIALDPLSIGANLQFGSVLMMARRYEDAISQWQHALQMDAGFVNAYRGIATSYAYLGLFDKALEAADQAAKKSPLAAEDQELKADRAYILALAGRRRDALRVVREMTDRNQRAGEKLEGSIAAIHAGLKDTEAAFAWLTRARDLRDPEVGFLKVDPRWDPLRADRRFGVLLESLGLN